MTSPLSPKEPGTAPGSVTMTNCVLYRNTAPGSPLREAWLTDLVGELRGDFEAAGYPLPPIIGISCGWPSRSPLARSNRRIGECWSGEAHKHGAPQIFISPLLDDSVEVGAVVVHELIHAALPKAKHGPAFKRAMTPLGLQGKPTATEATPELNFRLQQLVPRLGVYPHGAISPPSRAKVQSTRMLKLACPECGYTVRTTARWIEIGLPSCPCGGTLEPA